MDGRKHAVVWWLWGGVSLAVLGLSTVFLWTQLQELKQRQTNLPVISQLPEFTLTNQNGQPVTLADLRGDVWLADIIFTRCAGPCPRMTQRMSELQTALPTDGKAKLVTLTTDPEFDTPAVMKRYGERFGANFDRWLFLTGPKQQIGHLARDGLKLAAIEKKTAEQTGPEDLFIHSTIFVLVDKQGRLRGSFDSTEPDFKPKVLAAIRTLSKEQ